jgi:hypothetical protein
MNYCFSQRQVNVQLFGEGGLLPEQRERCYTVKKRLATFPSPAGMSLTKLSLGGNNYNNNNKNYSRLVLGPCPSCLIISSPTEFSKTTLLFSSFEYSLHLCMPEMMSNVPRPLTVSCLIFLLTKTSFFVRNYFFNPISAH